MNKRILNIFENFTVDGVEIPVEFLKYKGDKKTYITFQDISDQPALCGDDTCEYSVITYDFDIYTDGNFKKILSAVKTKLVENGFVWTEDSPTMYEEDTGLFHKTTTFEIENI